MNIDRVTIWIVAMIGGLVLTALSVREFMAGSPAAGILFAAMAILFATLAKRARTEE